jgi:hypothetical protein
MQNSSFPKSNTHTERFDHFDNERLFDRLGNKFTPKPYWKQYKALRSVVLGVSYLLNILSAVTAAALVYFFLMGMVGNMIVSAIITAVALFALEFTKRETSERLFVNVFQFGMYSRGLIGATLLLTALSVVSSYFGAQKVVQAGTPPPVLLDTDTETKALNNQLVAIDAQIKTAQRQTWRGKITAPAMATIDRLTRTRNDVVSATLHERERIKSKNDATEANHTEGTTNNANRFALFTLLCEVLFLVCMCYCEYYDYRSFVEQCSEAETTNTPTENRQKTTYKQRAQDSSIEPASERESALKGRTVMPIAMPDVVNNKPAQNDGIWPHLYSVNRHPIGFFSNPPNEEKPSTIAKEKSLSKQEDNNGKTMVENRVETVYTDGFTIDHNGKRYTLKDVQNFISIYTRRHNEAKRKGSTEVATSRLATLMYWNERKAELLNKATAATLNASPQNIAVA